MATVNPTLTSLNRGLEVAQWSGLAASDTGAAVDLGGYTDVRAQSAGDLTSVVVQGSLDGTNYVDYATLTGAATATLGYVRYIKLAAVSGGTDSSVTVIATYRP